MHSWGYVSEAMSIRYGKTKRLLKALATTARVLLLVSALSACLIFWIWTSQPGLVDRADNAIFGSYQKSFQSEYRKAIEHLERAETDESGRVLVTRQLSLLGNTYIPFSTTLPYKVSESTQARLSIQQADPRFNAIAYLYSVLVTLNP